MPAVTVALAEIEERLEEIRYRLNRRSVLSIAAPALGILLGLAALLIWSAWRYTPESFSLALGAAIGAAIGLSAWSGLVLWRRWLSLSDAARYADERGRMQQRLTTTLWLARGGRQPVLAPVLIADTIERGNSWRHHRRAASFPFELAYPVAGLVALIAAFFLRCACRRSLHQWSPRRRLRMRSRNPSRGRRRAAAERIRRGRALARR